MLCPQCMSSKVIHPYWGLRCPKCDPPFPPLPDGVQVYSRRDGGHTVVIDQKPDYRRARGALAESYDGTPAEVDVERYRAAIDRDYTNDAAQYVAVSEAMQQSAEQLRIAALEQRVRELEASLREIAALEAAPSEPTQTEFKVELRAASSDPIKLKSKENMIAVGERDGQVSITVTALPWWSKTIFEFSMHYETARSLGKALYESARKGAT